MNDYIGKKFIARVLFHTQNSIMFNGISHYYIRYCYESTAVNLKVKRKITKHKIWKYWKYNNAWHDKRVVLRISHWNIHELEIAYKYLIRARVCRLKSRIYYRFFFFITYNKVKLLSIVNNLFRSKHPNNARSMKTHYNINEKIPSRHYKLVASRNVGSIREYLCIA